MSTLPSELLIEICRVDNWQESGVFARCSHQMLRAMTRPDILKEIVDSIKSARLRLLRWLLFSIPSAFLFPSSSMETKALNPVIGFVSRELSIGVPDFFVTGGHICQELYGVYWDGSDIDVYVNRCDILTRRVIPEDGSLLDLHLTHSPRLECVIEDFDLSIVQQGLLGECYYQTPLSLYTWTHKEIIVMPRESNISYKVPGEEELRTVDIWHYIATHRDEHTEALFHRCEECYCHNREVITKWNKRVKKYCDRFPGFSLAYCQPPTACSSNLLVAIKEA